jgi:dUTP pyrophosphatase
MNIRFALYENDESFTPSMAHEGDACYDLFARSYAAPDSLEEERDHIYIGPGQRVLARTGVFLELQPGWEALVRPRSGNALKSGLTVLNTPGTIDAGYRNEVGVILHNAGQMMLELKRGMKIAQIAFRPIPAHSLKRIGMDAFDGGTERGLGGFGSSGT